MLRTAQPALNLPVSSQKLPPQNRKESGRHPHEVTVAERLRKRQLYTPPKEQLFVNTGPEAWRRHATETRTLSCLQFELGTPEYSAFVCWPFLPEPERSCAKLLDSRITWLTSRAGDSVMMRHGDSTEWTKERIKFVTLFRVHPVRYNDLVVTCGADWLEGVPAMHKDALGRYADGIPCDQRGYIPTAETWAFDLMWPHDEHYGIKSTTALSE